MTKRAFGPQLLIACVLGLAVAACSDPQAKKVRHLEKGDARMAEGKYADAVIEYRNAIKIDQRYGEARLQLAKAYEKTGNAQAGREYIRAAELLPSRTDAQVKAAAILIAAKEYEQARKHADLAIKADPRSVEAQVLRAYTLAGLKDMNGAIEELEKAMESAPGDFRPHASLGVLEAASGKLPEAEAAFKKAVQADPTSAQAKVALAYFYLSTRKVADAERVLVELLGADQANVAANRLLALLYLGTQRSKQAEAPLLRLVNMKDRRAMLLLGDLYAATARGEQARPLYESLKSEKPTRQLAAVRLAALDYSSGRRSEAHAALDAELKETPKSTSLLVLKGQWLTGEGRSKEALETAKKAVAIDADSAQTQLFLARAQAANRDYDAAIAAYKEVLRLNPTMMPAQMELSSLLLAAGQTDEALQHAQTARKAAPAHPLARLTVARALLRKGDVRAAEAELKTLSAQFPQSAAVHALTGHALLARSDAAGAAREFDRALALNAADVEALAGRITVDLSQKRSQDARARVERAIAKAPNSAPLLITAALFERTNGNAAAAESYLRKAIEIEPNNLETYTQLARLYISQKRLADGQRELEELVRRKPDSVGARTMIGIIQQMQGRTEEAIKSYGSLVKETKTAGVASNNLAYLYAERGEQLDLAVELAQSAKQRMPDNPDVSDTLGWVYYKKGMPEAAVKPLEFSVQKDPQNPLYLVHLGLAYAKSGQPQKAKTTLAQALKLNADVEGAAEARAVLASIQN